MDLNFRQLLRLGIIKNHSMLIKNPYQTLEPYPEIALPRLLERTAEKYPDKTALIGVDEKSYTFREVYEISKRVGRLLQDKNLKKGDRVAIFSPNSPEYVIAFYGILAAGGVVTPLNPLYKERELKFQMNDSEAFGVFVSRPLLPVIETLRSELPSLKHIFILEDIREIVERTFDDPYLVEINPREDLAALPYSSGTTGLPKGVMLTHFNLVANARQFLASGLVTRYSTALDFLPLYHIYGLTLLMNGSISVGATQVLLSRFDTEDVLRMVEKYRVTTLFVVPPVLLRLMNFPDPNRFDTSSLRSVLSGAAPLAPEIEKRVEELYRCTVIQGYGLTETSPITNLCPVDRKKLSSICPPMADSEEKILHIENGEELPSGEVGELLVKGPQVMKGYWKSPEATSQSFTQDRWFRTGDIARADVEGYVYIVDRRKEMIKCRGYQVAPAELEALLLEHPAVLDAAVIPKPDTEVGEIPKAFIVLKPGRNRNTTEEEILKFVEAKIAPYKRVKEVEFTENIPKSPSGKILRRELIEKERRG